MHQALARSPHVLRELSARSDVSADDAFGGGSATPAAPCHATQAALGDAYRSHRDRIFTSVYRLVGSAATAADLTHDAFLRALEQIPRFRGEAALGTWIGRIAVNLALRHLHRERRMLVADPVALAALERPTLAAPSLAEALDLDRAIAALPDALRLVFVLHAVEGYTYAEVAAMLDTTEAACRQRLHRARVHLAAALSEPRVGGEARP